MFEIFFQNAGLLVGGTLALVMLLCGALLVGIGLFTLQRRGAAASWPQVPATIEASEVRAERHFEDDLMYRPLVRYRYAAPGGSFVGDKLATTDRLYGKEADAQKVVRRYPVGITVMARYNPADPAEAVIEEGGSGGVAFIVFGLLSWIFPVLAAYAVGLSWTLIAAVLCCPVLLITWLLLRNNSGLAARAGGLYPPAGQGSDADILTLLGRGEKLLAIRLYRQLHGGGLKEAKEAVEIMARDGRS
jgi:hypothetical protein